MIDFIDVITEKDFEFLQNKIQNFQVFDTPDGNRNFYVRHHLSIENDIIETRKNIQNYIREKMNINYHLGDLWINKVTPDTNKDDKFHYDINDLTVLTFLNRNFIGGNFEYIINGKKEFFEPEIKKSIVTNDKISHRVAPVSEGERYTLVMFYHYDKKNKKSII